MKETKLFIKNRDNKKIALIIDRPENPKGLVFIMHGLGGFKEQKHIVAFAEAFKEHNFMVVRFDARNSIGKSEGSCEYADITSYYQDLEDVISWSGRQGWYQQPFYLAGHSLGGICTSLYSEKYPKKVKALAPISTVISGKRILDREPKERVVEWERTGWKISPSKSKPGVIRKFNWHKYVEDAKKYDILPDAGKLKMPILLIVGDEDHGTPPEDQKLLYDRTSGYKELHIIKGGAHKLDKTNELAQIKSIFNNWIKKVENKQKV